MREDIHEAFGRALECVRDQWAATPGVSAVIVYGSYLARKMGRYSDLDIMVIRSEDHPLRTVTAVECDMLVSLTIMGLGEFTRRLNAGCLSPLRLMLARHEVLFDSDGKATAVLGAVAPCSRYEVDQHAFALLHQFLLSVGRAEHYMALGETLDALHHSFHGFERALMLALLEKALPFDTDLFNSGLTVRPDIVTRIQDIMGNSTYDLALVTGLLEELKEERDQLLEHYRAPVLSYFPRSAASLSELLELEVFCETGYVLFQSFVERGDLVRICETRPAPAFPDLEIREVAFARNGK